jgi:hypothetical protein
MKLVVWTLATILVCEHCRETQYICRLESWVLAGGTTADTRRSSSIRQHLYIFVKNTSHDVLCTKETLLPGCNIIRLYYYYSRLDHTRSHSVSLWRSHNNSHPEGSNNLTWPRGNGNLACDGRKRFSMASLSMWLQSWLRFGFSVVIGMWLGCWLLLDMNRASECVGCRCPPRTQFPCFAAGIAVIHSTTGQWKLGILSEIQCRLDFSVSCSATPHISTAWH